MSYLISHSLVGDFLIQWFLGILSFLWYEFPSECLVYLVDSLFERHLESILHIISWIIHLIDAICLFLVWKIEFQLSESILIYQKCVYCASSPGCVWSSSSCYLINSLLLLAIWLYQVVLTFCFHFTNNILVFHWCMLRNFWITQIDFTHILEAWKLF
jgi:hypothetical protein